MKIAPIYICVSFKWWLPIYLFLLQFYVRVTGKELDTDKLAEFISKRAITYTFKAG